MERLWLQRELVDENGGQALVYAVEVMVSGNSAGVCAGQRRLEAYLWEELRSYSREVHEDPTVKVTMRDWKAAFGGGCLHLVLDPIAFGYFMSVLLPLLDGPLDAARLHGMPGLRLAHVGSGRVDLRYWDGHGRVVLLPEEEDLENWITTEIDDSAMYTICNEACPPSPCTLAAASRHPLRHLLRHHPILHPAEHAELLRTSSTNAETRASEELRATLSTLPPPARTSHDLLLFGALPAGPVTPVAPLHDQVPAPFPKVLPPDLFRAVTADNLRPADMGDSLALQLLQLLAVLPHEVGAMAATLGGRAGVIPDRRSPAFRSPRTSYVDASTLPL